MAGVVARRVVTPILQPPPRRASSAGDSASSSASSSHPQPPFTLLSLSPTDLTLTVAQKKIMTYFSVTYMLVSDPRLRSQISEERGELSEHKCLVFLAAGDSQRICEIKFCWMCSLRPTFHALSFLTAPRVSVAHACFTKS